MYIKTVLNFISILHVILKKSGMVFMWCFFENHEIPYNLKLGNLVKLPGTNTTKYGINSLNFRDPMLWNIIPKNTKLSKTLPEFKRRLKKHLISWNCATCRF